MRVKKKLQLVTIGLIITGITVFIIFALVVDRVDNALEQWEISGKILTTAFERSTFRDDYLRTGSDRARREWFAKQKEMERLLKSASQKFDQPEELEIVNGMISGLATTTALFSEIVELEERELSEASKAKFRQKQDLLGAKLEMRRDADVVSAGRLQEAVKNHVTATFKIAGWGILLVVAVVSAAVIGTLIAISRTITTRVSRLREDALAIGAGNLNHRIAIPGNDEFAELSRTFNAMTEKLHSSYRSLESEVAQHKLVEEALQESSERFRAIFDNAGVGIVEVEQGDAFVAVNHRMCEILDYSPAELLKMNVHELTAPEDRPLSDYINQQVREGLPRAAYDKRYQKRDGSHLWVHVNISGVRDAEGHWRSSITTVEDISARKAAESVLQVREEELREAQRLAGVGSWRWEPGSDTAYWSEETFRIFGLEHGDVPNFHNGHSALFTQESFADLNAALNLALTAGVAYELDLEVIRRDGSKRWVIVRGEADRDETGEVRALHGTIQDITARKQAEEELRRAKEELEERVRERTEELTLALEKLKAETVERLQAVEELRGKEQMLLQQSRLAAMGEMLGNISHQWRQPLSILSLILQEMNRKYGQAAFTRDYLEQSIGRARQIISHISQTIDDFRSFLNPQKTKLAFDVREVVERAVSMIEESLRGVEVNVLSEESSKIEGYRNEYAQALINLLTNARDAFRERHIQAPRLTIRIFRKEGHSVVTVADNAGGISADIIDRIFEPYFTTKGPDKGTGIGLFMSKTIIERNMGGILKVRNNSEGAEFRIEIPEGSATPPF